MARTRLKKDAARVNPTTRSGFIPRTDERAPKEVRGNTRFTARARDPNEAMPPTSSWKDSTYKTGDGDVLAIRRPGSDHSHIKTFGDPT
jgi:hypothetical protein